ncbi:nucleotidyltransferase [Sulfurihydrogenibium subterraneum]|uniref:nucleotidyltransferase n=1 Tax=Sulfurihydrogenibium subterraneum TaxID=171121 RepID=UPI00048E233D|nr:nucleotidyltransferase [Sulfurihydrogenibium subterraneum]
MNDKEKILELLKQFVVEKKEPLELLLVGALALPFYDVEFRFTYDLDAELQQGNIEDLYFYLKSKGFESDLSENVSGWSVISMPSGYRERCQIVYQNGLLTIKILSPEDYIIMKLRRGTTQDIEDALAVGIRKKVKKRDLDVLYEKVLKESIKDTALFNFKKIYALFINELLKRQ